MEFSENLFAKHMSPISGSAIRDIFKLLGKPGMISFAGGNPSNQALEPEVIAPIAEEVIRTVGAPILQYGATEGYAPLRGSIRAFLKEDGIDCAEEEILPTEGSTQGMDLLLKTLIDPGDTVLVEDPTFLGALQAIRTYHANIVPVPSDEKGVIPEALEDAIKAHHPKLIYVIPTFQNPTGLTLTIERRKRIAELAAQYGVIVAEDDPYRDLRYAGEAVPTIKSFDKEGWVVYLASFSKLISPGLRVGAAMVKNPALMRKLVVGKQSTDLHTPTLSQAITAEYLSRGLLPGHMAKILGMYREQLALMLRELAKLPVKAYPTEGGLFVWCEMDERVDALKLLQAAVQNNVAFVPGTHFYANGGHLNTLRLNFSNSTPEQIVQGVHLLEKSIQELR